MCGGIEVFEIKIFFRIIDLKELLQNSFIGDGHESKTTQS